jgi:uncharacterized membrane protein YdjX (TVP38/TMEM64 family)
VNAPARFPWQHRRAHRLQVLAPAWRGAAWALLLFVLGMVLVARYAQPLQQALAEREGWGMGVFFASSALAVLLPAASNLPLVPVAVLAWGPRWTAALLLLGWVAGAAAAFALARHLRPHVMRWVPAAARHVEIDRLVDADRRLLSLITLRMTFPVDVLSYALGLFSARVTLGEIVLSTLIGAAPFALLFAWFPALPLVAQVVVAVASVAGFALHVWWVLDRAER